MKIEIQRRLEGAERKSRRWKEKANEEEREVNQDEDSLAKLREGWFVSLAMAHVCSSITEKLN